jgi:hypothetical protein
MTDFALNRVLPGREPITVYATGAKSGDTVPVWINGTTVNVRCARDITPATNDVLFLQRSGLYWVAVARLGTAAVAPPIGNVTPPDPKPSVTTGRSTFGPVETRSYRSSGPYGVGWRTDNDDVYQGQYGGNGLHVGCAFYGDSVLSLGGATVTGAWIQVRRHNGGGITAAQGTTLWLVTERFKPGGAPTRGASTGGPSLAWGQSATFGIPASWAQSMANGTAGGLAIYVAGGSPYVIMDGRGAYGPSFTLIVDWSR